MTTESMLAKIKIDETNRELRERNEVRLAAAKLAMGKKYLLHPENMMTKAKYDKITMVLS